MGTYDKMRLLLMQTTLKFCGSFQETLLCQTRSQVVR